MKMLAGMLINVMRGNGALRYDACVTRDTGIGISVHERASARASVFLPLQLLFEFVAYFVKLL